MITFSKSIHPVGSMFLQLPVRFSPVKGTATKWNTIIRKELIWQSAPPGLCLLSTFLQSWMMVQLCKNVFVSFHQGSNYVGKGNKVIKVIKYLSIGNICSAMSSCEGCDPSFIITCSCYDDLVCPTLLHIRHLLEMHCIEVSIYRFWTYPNIVCQCLS